MWVRSAFWTGAPKHGAEGPFRAAIDEELVPALRTLPGVAGARSLWPRRLEDEPPNVACQVLVEFDTREDVDRMLASEGRAALRLRVREIAAMFDGAISHIDYEVGA
jgi:hypothetical protein